MSKRTQIHVTVDTSSATLALEFITAELPEPPAEDESAGLLRPGEEKAT